MQLAGTILKGRHDSLLGTELFLTEGSGGQLEHGLTTSQRVVFREVALEMKGDEDDDEEKEKEKKTPNGRKMGKKARLNIEKWDVSRDPEALERLTGRLEGPAEAERPTRRRRKGKEKAKEPTDDEDDDDEATQAQALNDNDDDSDEYQP